MELKPFESSLELKQYVYDKIIAIIGENPTHDQISQLARKMFISEQHLQRFLDLGPQHKYRQVFLLPLLAYFHTPLEVVKLGEIALDRYSKSTSLIQIDAARYYRNPKVFESMLHLEILQFIQLKSPVKLDDLIAQFGENLTSSVIADLIQDGLIEKNENLLKASKYPLKAPSIDCAFKKMKSNIDILPQNPGEKNEKNYKFISFNTMTTEENALSIFQRFRQFERDYHSVIEENANGQVENMFTVMDGTFLTHQDDEVKSPWFFAREEKIDTVINVAKKFAKDVSIPFSNIEPFLKKLQQSKNVEEVKLMIQEYSNYFLKSSKQLNHLIQNILDINAPIYLNKVKFKITDVLLRAVNEFEFQNPTIAFNVVYQLNHKNEELIGDCEKIVRSVINILLNCVVEETKNVNLTIKTNKMIQSESEYFELVICTDQRILYQSQIQGLFDTFDTSLKENSGLALATSYKIIAAHLGKISFASIPDIGTEFKLIIPYSHEG